MNDDLDQDPFQRLLQSLLDESGENCREASLASGLYHTSISSYLRGKIPGRDACIALAHHFGINPNQIFEAVGYEPLPFFDSEDIDVTRIGFKAKLVLDKMERIKNPRLRAQLFRVIDVMLETFLQELKNGAR